MHARLPCSFVACLGLWQLAAIVRVGEALPECTRGMMDCWQVALPRPLFSSPPWGNDPLCSQANLPRGCFYTCGRCVPRCDQHHLVTSISQGRAPGCRIPRCGELSDDDPSCRSSYFAPDRDCVALRDGVRVPSESFFRCPRACGWCKGLSHVGTPTAAPTGSPTLGDASMDIAHGWKPEVKEDINNLPDFLIGAAAVAAFMFILLLLVVCFKRGKK